MRRAEEAGDIWKCSFSAFIVQHAFFTSFNLFCSNSQVKNSFHEPEPAATALCPAMALGTSWGPCPCVPPPTAAAWTLRNGHEAQDTQLGSSSSLLQLHCPTPTPFSPRSCNLVFFWGDEPPPSSSGSCPQPILNSSDFVLIPAPEN